MTYRLIQKKNLSIDQKKSYRLTQKKTISIDPKKRSIDPKKIWCIVLINTSIDPKKKLLIQKKVCRKSIILVNTYRMFSSIPIDRSRQNLSIWSRQYLSMDVLINIYRLAKKSLPRPSKKGCHAYSKKSLPRPLYGLDNTYRLNTYRLIQKPIDWSKNYESLSLLHRCHAHSNARNRLI